jgi:hypothetical protein
LQLQCSTYLNWLELKWNWPQLRYVTTELWHCITFVFFKFLMFLTHNSAFLCHVNTRINTNSTK